MTGSRFAPGQVMFSDMQIRPSPANLRRMRHKLFEPLRTHLIRAGVERMARLAEAGDRESLYAYCRNSRLRKARVDSFVRKPVHMDMVEDYPAWPDDEQDAGPAIGSEPQPPQSMRWYKPRKGQADGLMFYVHGGGFLAEASPAVTTLVTRLAGKAGTAMVRPAYRLAPEHPCPAAVEDVLENYRRITRARTDVVIVAESCGANIALVMLQQARKQGLPMPRGILLFSPWIDLSLSHWSVISHSLARKSALSLDVLALARHLYLQGRSPLDEWANPLSGSFEGFPPILVHASKTDPFRDDAELLANRIKAANGALMVRLWLDEGHVWEIYGGLEAERSTALAAEFIRQCMRHPPSSG